MTADSFELGIKRFYLDTVVTDTCSKCGSEAHRDLSDHYLSYPTANAMNDVELYCDTCGDWTTTVQRFLALTLRKEP